MNPECQESRSHYPCETDDYVDEAPHLRGSLGMLDEKRLIEILILLNDAVSATLKAHTLPDDPIRIQIEKWNKLVGELIDKIIIDNA